MKSLSSLQVQRSSVKLQTINSTQQTNTGNSMSKLISNKNFTKPNQSSNVVHNNQQLRKKQPANSNMRKNVNINKQRISRSIQQLPYIQTDVSMTSLFNSRQPIIQTPSKNMDRSKISVHFQTPSSKISKNQSKMQMLKKQILIQNCQQSAEQLFSQSYKKINRIYATFSQSNTLNQNMNDKTKSKNKSLAKNQNLPNKQEKTTKNTIEEQLSQILQLIKQQRQVIKLKFEQLEGKKGKKYTSTVQVGQNTETIIQILSKDSKQIQVQTQTINPQNEINQQQKGRPSDLIFDKQSEKKVKNRVQIQVQKIQSNQTYKKLIKILQDMNINSKQILPVEMLSCEQSTKSEDSLCQSSNNEQNTKAKQRQKKYQQLKQSQVITVQKFVIKKLAQRISVLQSNLIARNSTVVSQETQL